jgi:hypothetical protein
LCVDEVIKENMDENVVMCEEESHMEIFNFHDIVSTYLYLDVAKDGVDAYWSRKSIYGALFSTKGGRGMESSEVRKSVEWRCIGGDG